MRDFNYETVYMILEIALEIMNERITNIRTYMREGNKLESTDKEKLRVISSFEERFGSGWEEKKISKTIKNWKLITEKDLNSAYKAKYKEDMPQFNKEDGPDSEGHVAWLFLSDELELINETIVKAWFAYDKNPHKQYEYGMDYKGMGYKAFISELKNIVRGFQGSPSSNQVWNEMKRRKLWIIEEINEENDKRKHFVRWKSIGGGTSKTSRGRFDNIISDIKSGKI